jgi:pSer/pThr/pTyr-binding forkhead associated (FHA) protein
MLGLLEALDRNGIPLARLPITRWPVTVGRSLDCDMVLDDQHVAPQHLRLDRAPNGLVGVRVLNTVNGVTLGQQRQPAGAEFDWPQHQDMRLGRLRLNLRLADTPLAPEQALPSFSVRRAGLTLLLLTLLGAWQLLLLWFGSTDADKFALAMPTRLGGMVGALAVWCALWAMATKIFSGHAHFWRHVRIICAVALAEALATGGAHLLAFMFSWETLARLDYFISAGVLTVGIYWQLTVVSPMHKRGMRVAMASLFLFAVATVLGTTWLQTKRLTSQKQLYSLFPPGLRMAPAVPVKQFIDESGALKQRLDERLKENQSAEGNDDDRAD